MKSPILKKIKLLPLTIILKDWWKSPKTKITMLLIKFFLNDHPIGHMVALHDR